MASHTGLWPHYTRRLDELLALDVRRQVPRRYGHDLMVACMVGRPRHSAPNLASIAVLKRWSRNERIERVRQHTGRVLTLPDMPSAFPRHYTSLPDGTSCRVLSHPGETLATWFMRCVVAIPSSLALSPIPVRHEEAGRTEWWQGPGERETWLWREQAEDAGRLGCFVRPLEGFGWLRLTSSQSTWVSLVIGKREEAGRTTPAGLAWKAAANHAIGFMGAGTHYRRRVKHWQPGDLPVMSEDGDRLTGEGDRLVRGIRTMVHWQRYCVMQCSRTVFWQALDYAREGRLVAIETDCIRLAA